MADWGDISVAERSFRDAIIKKDQTSVELWGKKMDLSNQHYLNFAIENNNPTAVKYLLDNNKLDPADEKFNSKVRNESLNLALKYTPVGSDIPLYIIDAGTNVSID